MSYLVICICAFGASALTLYSGFGLGTLLLPAFAIFFPVEIAVAATAVVHGANNVFKMAAVGRFADRSIVYRFGIPAIFAAFMGAFMLGYLSRFGEWFSYSIGSHTAVVTPVKLNIAVLMFIFGLFEVLPRLKRLKFDRKYLFLGGILSGFFGGLSGHQGALRSAFLVKIGIPTDAFVGTNAVIGFMVDMARIIAYVGLLLLARKTSPIGPGQWPLILAGVLAAFFGVLIGRRFLDKITMTMVQTLTGVLLFIIALALGTGII